VRWGVINPSASQARNAEEEIPTRWATWLMRKEESGLREIDASDRFFFLDITTGFP
jgi:hypothetical protein